VGRTAISSNALIGDTDVLQGQVSRNFILTATHTQPEFARPARVGEVTSLNCYAFRAGSPIQIGSKQLRLCVEGSGGDHTRIGVSLQHLDRFHQPIGVIQNVVIGVSDNFSSSCLQHHVPCAAFTHIAVGKDEGLNVSALKFCQEEVASCFARAVIIDQQIKFHTGIVAQTFQTELEDLEHIRIEPLQKRDVIQNRSGYPARFGYAL